MAQVFKTFKEAESALRESVNAVPSARNYHTEHVSLSDPSLGDNPSDWLTSRHMAGFGNPEDFWSAMGL